MYTLIQSPQSQDNKTTSGPNIEGSNAEVMSIVQ